MKRLRVLKTNAIRCRWIYKIKRKVSWRDNIERYKIRAVAKGYTQLEGLNFLYTFSPVAKLTIIRVCFLLLLLIIDISSN